MRVQQILRLALVCILASMSAPAFSQGNGSKPKGKPFVEIQGQFVEVVERIEDLESAMDDVVGRVDSLEDRVYANESAIAGLQATNAILQQEVSDLVTQAAANNADVQAALDRIAAAESEIDVLKTDAASNADAILALEGEIYDLQNVISANTEGLQSLQTKIENNEMLIGGLEDEIDEINAALAMKQDILDGQCPPGTALTSIDPDGGITCAVAAGGLTKFTVTRSGYVSSAYSYLVTYSCGFFSTCYRTEWYYPQATLTATCPVGSLLTGGSAYASNLSIRRNSSTWTVDHPANSWIVTVQNYRTYSQYFYSRAECMTVN